MAFECVAFAGFEWGNGCEGYEPRSGNVYGWAPGGADSHLGYYGVELGERGAGLFDFFVLQSFTYAEHTLITFYIKFDEMAPSPTIPFLFVYDQSGGTHFKITLKNNGDISLTDANGVERDTYGGLAADTWYRFHVYWKRDNSTGSVYAWINDPNFGASSVEVIRRLSYKDVDFSGGTIGPTWVSFDGQTGIAATPGKIVIGAAAIFTGAESGEYRANLNEGVGRRQWGVPFHYSPLHATNASDFSTTSLNYGSPDSDWESMGDVPFTADYAGFTAVEYPTAGMKRCDDGNWPGPYGGGHIDYQDRGKVLAAGWAFQCRTGTIAARYGKGDDSAPTYATSGSFTLRSGIQYFFESVSDSKVPLPEDQESALVGLVVTPPAPTGALMAASACILYVPPWHKRVMNGSHVGGNRDRMVISG